MDIVDRLSFFIGEEVTGQGVAATPGTTTDKIAQFVGKQNVLPTPRTKKKKKLVSGTIALQNVSSISAL